MGGKILKVLVENKKREEVLMLKDLLANFQEKFENEIFESLQKLQSMELSVETLQATEIEKTIKCLQNHPVKRIKHLAKLLINFWKLLKDVCANTEKNVETNPESANVLPAKEEDKLSVILALPANPCDAKTTCFNRTDNTESLTSSRKIKIRIKARHVEKEDDAVMRSQVVPSPLTPPDVPSRPVTMTASPQGFEQNTKHLQVQDLSKKVENQPFEDKLKTTKRKLQEAYLKEKNGKKQRCIKLIEFKDLLKKDNHCEKPKLIARCCPKKCTNWQAKRGSSYILK